MEEEDIRALSRWPGEPNFQEDWLQNTVMDRLLSNSFFEPTRVQKLFDTKARPRKPQINVIKAQPQPQINFYVPGGRVSIESSQRSQLFAGEQKEYLRLYLKCKAKNPFQKLEENMFNFLHQKVIEENIQFEEFVQESMLKSEDDFTLMESVRKYTSQAWQCQLAEVDEYPALFKVIATLPLVSSLDGSLVKMKLEKTVLEVGEPPCVYPPQFTSKLCCIGEYDKMCQDYPVERSARRMGPVSRDSTAEKLALAHNADIVVSCSALEHIADNYPNYDRVWDIPVVIKQLEREAGSGESKKIIFIDRALPPTTLTAEQRNIWFHKIAVKKMFCNQDNASAKSPAKRPKYVAKKNNANCTSNRLHLKTRPAKEVGRLSVAEVLSPAVCCTSEDDDGVEMNDASVNEGSVGDAQLSSDLNMLSLSSSDSMSQRGVKRKSTDATVSLGIESDCGDESDGSSSDGDDKLMIACDDEVCDGQAKERKNKQKSSVAKKKKTVSFSSSDDIRPTNQTDTCDETVLQVQSYKPGSPSRQEDINVTSAVLSEPLKPLCVQQADEPNQSSLEAQPNVVYSLWQLSLQEAEKEDLKERILKKKIENKHLRILVRCKVDGVKTAGNKSQKLCIIPKLEHKVHFGAERLSTSEIIRSWVAMFFRPDVVLARVRVDAKTSEVLMFEETGMKELMEYASFSKFPVQSMVLGTLYNVLTALDCYGPGTYLMSHRRDSFFNFLQADEENGRHSLQTVYRINCSEVSATRKSQYLPIDPNVLMPRNVMCNRIPATFNPKKADKPAKKKSKKKFKKRK